MNARLRFVPIAAVMLALVGCDKAREPYSECANLEAAGSLGEAMMACERATRADPSTNYGKLALAKAAEIQSKLDDIVPAAVTQEWCSRLRNRIEARLSTDAQKKYGSAGANVANAIHDNVLNVEHDCLQSAGQPTKGLWACRWNETLDNYDRCDTL